MTRHDRRNEPLPLWAYGWINAIAWLAFAAVFGLVGLVTKDWSGMGGFFLIFAAAFAAASVFDFLYDRWIAGDERACGAASVSGACDTPVASDPSDPPEKRRRTRRR